MLCNPNPISIDYPTSHLRILVEEFITRQKAEFSLDSACSFVVFWAMEEGRTGDASSVFCDSNRLQDSDRERIRQILESIVKDGRLRKVEGYDTMYLKQ